MKDSNGKIVNRKKKCCKNSQKYAKNIEVGDLINIADFSSAVYLHKTESKYNTPNCNSHPNWHKLQLIETKEKSFCQEKKAIIKDITKDVYFEISYDYVAAKEPDFCEINQ